MDLPAAVDWVLEVSVLGSFSAPGYAIRRRLFGWREPGPDALRGCTVLVTGPTSGLGRAAADAFAAAGARVLLVGRSEERLGGVRDALAARHGEDRFLVVVADMASLESVGAAVAAILEREPRLDVLVDNAGLMPPDRGVSPDGIELTLATMVVGPFALTAGLLPRLRSDGGRVIAVTSGGMYTQAVEFDDLQWTSRPYSGPRAYAMAKRIQVALAREWARRLAGAGVTFYAMHPGWADTPGLAESLPGFYRLMRPVLRTPAEGADTIAWLATDPTVPALSGRLFLDRRPRPFDRIRSTRLSAAERRRLWETVVALAGIPDPAPH
jgi:dehydrogenase/reductase SDR family member 12